MPTFVLKCQKCNHQFEFLKLREIQEPVCPKCGNEKGFDKQPTASTIVFKGEGWQTPNYVASVDPTSVPGVKRIEPEKQNPQQKTLYKHRKEVTGKRKKIKIKGMPEVNRRLPLGKE